ncbi:PREDICTED: putative B3 domain-containing protein At5g66980 [Theobroma cacao]|uniref:B3 domain-containing protein At5g66980 n=1 Tax=Theobroma cacao TaxID=3641 RepID=A0AB32W396_THECC|nr:PREDICTED: putative B3 domain-containing protein At5g66980 [Theobroma cacao]
MAKPRKQCHKFFKVYLPFFNSQQLKIPPAFVRHLDGTIPKDAMLKNHTGKHWLVDLEEVEGGLTMTNGWQGFASENSLEFGDFLIFEYDGKCLFDVEIFGRNGCNKAALSSNMTTTHAVNEKEIKEVDICNEPTQTCKQKYSVKNLGYKLRRNRGTNLGEGKALNAATYVTPKGPYFVSNIPQSMRSAVYVPRSLLASYGIKIKPEVVLLDQNGKKWPVMVSSRTDGRVFIHHGWGSFRHEYNLQKGDKCVFEFVLGRGNISQKRLVQVIRRQAP